MGTEVVEEQLLRNTSTTVHADQEAHVVKEADGMLTTHFCRGVL